MKLQVIKTTDGQYEGKIFTVPFADLSGIELPISEGVTFSINSSVDQGNGFYVHSNAHYIALCKEVD